MQKEREQKAGVDENEREGQRENVGIKLKERWKSQGRH